MSRTQICAYILTIVSGANIAAQDAPQAPGIWRLSLSGSLRGRVENWDWFKAAPADSGYTYAASILRVNLGVSSKTVEWQADGAFPLLINLPVHAVAPGSQGPLGYGGDYFLANQQRNIGAAVLRQAFMAVRNARLKFRVGRLEFADGVESVPANATLAELKRERIAQRLIATFNYALRSLDGAQLTYDRSRSNVTVLAGRVVEGSFQLRAFNEINVDLSYGAYTRSLSTTRASSEFRLFSLYYHDGRGVVKSDSRPDSALALDPRPIRLATPGAHFISAIQVGPGTADMLLWGAGQFGRWGLQRHVAGEIVAEAGYRFSAKAQPWIRVGYFRSSGDPDPNDNRHNTFFQVLSTPRAYARFPSYILMNTEDRFGQFKFTPAKRLARISHGPSIVEEDTAPAPTFPDP